MEFSSKRKKTIGLILLAAGRSERMGQPKQLLSVDNEPLIVNMTKKALGSSCFPVIAVLGANASRISTEIEDLPVYIEINQKWQRGMSSSIECGLHCLENVYPYCEGVILMVVDQPFVDSGLLNRLIECFKTSGKKIVASKYKGTCGTPALFSKKLIPQLLEIEADRGAKTLIKKYKPHDVYSVDFPEGEIELDTPEDYLLYQRNSGNL